MQGATGASPAPVPLPMSPADQLAPAATPGRTEIVSVAASAAGHLLVGVLIFGSLASAHIPPPVIPVRLIPAEQPQPKPPQPPAAKSTGAPKEKPASLAAEKPPPAAQADAPKTTPASGKEPSSPADAAPAKESKAQATVSASPGKADRGRKTALSPALLATLSAEAKRCWQVPSGWNDPHQVTVTLRFQMLNDGRLNGEPTVVEFPATLIGAAAAKAAMEAVKQCGPYHLPATQYDAWKDVQLTLAP